jgi:O-antigen/teichoic acid export membrane protein
MGIVFRQSVKTTIVTFTGAGLGAIIVLVSPMLMEKAEVGFVSTLTYLAATVQLLVMMGTSALVAVYTQRYGHFDERRKALLTIGMLVTVISSLIFSIAFFALRGPIIGLYNASDQALISKYYHFIPFVVLFMALGNIIEHYLVANMKVAQSAFAKEIVLRLVNLSLLGLIYAGYIGFGQYIVGNVFMYMVPLLLFFIFASRVKGFGFTRNLKVFSLAEYKDMLHFSWYHLLVGSTLTLLGYIDTLMIAPLDNNGLEATAIYAIAVFITSFMFMPYRSMATASSPILNQAYIDKDMHKVRDLFARAGVNIFIAGTGMFVLIGVNLDNLVAVLPPGYEPVKYIVLILMIGKLADMATGLNNELISISRHYKFNFRLSALLLLMVVVLDWVFIPVYGIYGAAWVASCTLVFFNIVKMIFLYNKLKLKPFTGKTWLVPVAGLCAGLAGYFWPYLINPYIDAVTRTFVVMIAYVSALLLLKPSADLNSYLATIRKDKKLF